MDGIDIVRLLILRIVDKGQLERQVEPLRVADECLCEFSGGDNCLFDAKISELSELAQEDSLVARYVRHAFRLLRRQHPHPAPHSRVQYQRLHLCTSV